MIPIRSEQLNDQITSEVDMQAVALYSPIDSHTQTSGLCVTVQAFVQQLRHSKSIYHREPIHSPADCVAQTSPL